MLLGAGLRSECSRMNLVCHDCKKALANGPSRCGPCAKRRRTKYHARRRLGLCVVCGSPAARNGGIVRSHCDVHLLMQRKRERHTQRVRFRSKSNDGPKRLTLEWFIDATSIEATTGCWLWTRAADKHGYGTVYADGRNRAAHRVSYERLVGPTDGLHVLHRCDTPRCINPDHLFLGTNQDNHRDSARKGRRSRQLVTHCGKGHELSGSNLVPGYGHKKRCRECNKERGRAYYRRKRNAVLTADGRKKLRKGG